MSVIAEIRFGDVVHEITYEFDPSDSPEVRETITKQICTSICNSAKTKLSDAYDTALYKHDRANAFRELVVIHETELARHMDDYEEDEHESDEYKELCEYYETIAAMRRVADRKYNETREKMYDAMDRYGNVLLNLEELDG